MEAIRAVGRSAQRRLYEAVDGFGEVRLTDLVRPETADLATVRHYGRNTLPAFTHFEKRFCRPRGADHDKPGELYGFNFQSMAPITGPGYFVAHEDPGRPEVWVDYRRVPSEHPDGWPEISVNELVAAVYEAAGTPLATENGPARPADVRRHCSSSALASELIGFVPSVGIDHGLAQTVEWYRSRQRVAL